MSTNGAMLTKILVLKLKWACADPEISGPVFKDTQNTGMGLLGVRNTMDIFPQTRDEDTGLWGICSSLWSQRSQ